MISGRIPPQGESTDVASAILAALNRIGDRLDDLSDSVRILARREYAESPQSKAIRLLFELGPSNIREIARQAGVSKSALYRSMEFRETLARVRGAAAWIQRNPNSVRREEL